MNAGNTLTCCGCVVAYGPPSDCPCSCHDTAKVMWRINPRGWKS